MMEKIYKQSPRDILEKVSFEISHNRFSSYLPVKFVFFRVYSLTKLKLKRCSSTFVPYEFYEMF